MLCHWSQVSRKWIVVVRAGRRSYFGRSLLSASSTVGAVFNTSPLPSLVLLCLLLTDLHLNTGKSAWLLPPPVSTFSESLPGRDGCVTGKLLNTSLTSFAEPKMVRASVPQWWLKCCWLSWRAVSTEQNGLINVTSQQAPEQYNPNRKWRGTDTCTRAGALSPPHSVTQTHLNCFLEQKLCTHTTSV